MHKWHIAQDAPQSVAVLLFDGFSNLCLANAVEPLRVANTLAGAALYNWQYVTLDGQAVRSSSGLPVAPEGRLSRHAGGDFLFLLPGYGVAEVAGPAAGRALRAAAGRFETLVGLDTGAWLLAGAGLLEGRRATIHRDAMGDFEERFASVTLVQDRFVRDGDVLTCGGAQASFDLSLDLIARRHGEAMRLEVATFLLSPGIATARPVAAGTSSDLVNAAAAAMGRALETPLPLPVLARQVGAHPKTLARAFQTHLGASPRAVYRQLRLGAARRLVEQTGLSIAEIALRCGYQSPASMTRAFVVAFGTTPSALRKT